MQERPRRIAPLGAFSVLGKRTYFFGGGGEADVIVVVLVIGAGAFTTRSGGGSLPTICSRWNSHRRFLAMLALVSFGATCFVSPKPFDVRRLASIPWATRYATTASALCCESVWL